MRSLLLGALLAVLLLYPPLGEAVLGVAVAVASQPVALAFVLGLAAGLRARSRGWTR